MSERARGCGVCPLCKLCKLCKLCNFYKADPADPATKLLQSTRAGRLAGPGGHKDLRRIHRIEAVLLPAELAAHLDVFLFRQDAFGFVGPQVAQHVAHALAAAGAGKARAAGPVLRDKAQQLLLPEQAAQDGVHVQAQQFLAGQARGQVGNAVVVLVVADLVLVLTVAQFRARQIALVPPPDRRQSETALAVARGTARLLRSLGFSCIGELALPSGRRADLVALNERGEIWIIEIKSSVEDLRADHKWEEYRAHCDRLFFATSQDVPCEIFPPDTGLIVADAFGAAFYCEAPEHKLAAATRKSMLVLIARAAALRLQSLVDPNGPYGDVT